MCCDLCKSNKIRNQIALTWIQIKLFYLTGCNLSHKCATHLTYEYSFEVIYRLTSYWQVYVQLLSVTETISLVPPINIEWIQQFSGIYENRKALKDHIVYDIQLLYFSCNILLAINTFVHSDVQILLS